MSEVDIRAYLTEDDARFIARFCKTPKTASEIVQALLRYKGSSSIGLYERVVGNTLSAGESLRAVVYAEGKWKTTDITLRILKKYFGES